MGYWDKIKGYASDAANIGTFGIYDALTTDGGRGEMADEARGAYKPQIDPLLAALQEQSQGKDQFADQKLKQAMSKNIAAEQSVAATGRGNQALQQRQASQNIGALRSGLAQQSTMAGIQERALANQQLARLLAQLRGQDISLAGAQMAQPTSGERALGAAAGIAGAAAQGR